VLQRVQHVAERGLSLLRRDALAIGPSPARRGEAETLLARLGADVWDTQEWEDTQATDAPVQDVPVDDVPPWQGESPSGPVIADTVYSEDGMTITYSSTP
jgi:hypothetical protein